MLLLRNHNRKDLDQLGTFLPRPLPDVIMAQITRFPKPTELEGDQGYAGFVYVRLNQEEPRYCVGRNYISKEVQNLRNAKRKQAEAEGNGEHPIRSARADHAWTLADRDGGRGYFHKSNTNNGK
jgi:hypothetical protein